MAELRRNGRHQCAHRTPRLPLRRATLARMAQIYAPRFADPDGRIRATFEIVWLSGWRSAREPAEAAAPRLGENAPRRRARGARVGTGEKPR